jgi:hypothetical protein
MKTLKALLVFLLIHSGLSLVSLRAQPAAVQQMQNTQQALQQQQPLMPIKPGTNAPELYPGENLDVGPQYILSLVPRRTWFEAWLDSQVFYTANALLTDTGAKSAAVFVNTAQLSFVPTPGLDFGPGKFSPIAGFRSQWFNYSLNSPPNLDFNAQTAFVAGRYLYEQKWILTTELDFTRLLNQSDYRQFYREWVPNLVVQRIVPVNKNLAASITWQLAYHFTGVHTLSIPGAPPGDINDRLDNILTFAVGYQPAPKILVQPFFSFEYTYYPTDPFKAGGDRSDGLFGGGISLGYYFRPNLALRTFLSASLRTSNDSTADYRNLNVGADLALILRF